jgi:hypothetical protein
MMKKFLLFIQATPFDERRRKTGAVPSDKAHPFS